MLEMRNVIFFGLAISKEYLPNQLIALKERTEINKKKIVLIAKNVCFAYCSIFWLAWWMKTNIKGSKKEAQRLMWTFDVAP